MRLNKAQEALDLLQEECAEVIQAVSKIRRFGEDFQAKGGTCPSAWENLQTEVNDVKVLIELLEQCGYLEPSTLEEHRPVKLERMKQWTSLFNQAEAA